MTGSPNSGSEIVFSTSVEVFLASATGALQKVRLLHVRGGVSLTCEDNHLKFRP